MVIFCQLRAANLGVSSLEDAKNGRTLTRILLEADEEVLFGAEFIINHDPKLVFTSATAGDSAFVSNTSVPGQVKVAFADASGLSGNKILLKIEFGGIAENSSISVSGVSLNEGDLGFSGAPDRNLFDRDGDGVLDADEVALFGTNPDLKDSDNDGYDDGFEIKNSADPNDLDSFPTRSLTIEVSPNGIITGGGVYRPEDFAIIQAIPEPGYLFDSWVGEVSGNKNPLTIEMISSLTVGASFVADERDSDGDGLTNHEEIVVNQSDPDVPDSDGDGLTDGQEVNLTKTDPNLIDTDGDGVTDANDDQDGDNLNNLEEINDYKTNPDLADSDGDGFSDSEELRYSFDPNVSTTVSEIMLRLEDPRFVDSDADGITDAKEAELETAADEATVFYLQAAYDTSNALSLQAGKDAVTSSPSDYNLTPTLLYEEVVGEREDLTAEVAGLNQTLATREASIAELEGQKGDLITQVGDLTETVAARDTAISNLEGEKTALTTQVGDLNQTLATREASIAELSLRPTQEAYDVIEADRNSRFVDTDEDGITDVKEAELETAADEATVFYLQAAYDASNALSLQAGKDAVTSSPSDYNLTPTLLYEEVVADRDSRFVDTDSDGITDKKEVELNSDTNTADSFYLEADYESGLTAVREETLATVLENPSNYDLLTREAYNQVVAERDDRFVDTDLDGITDAKELELETDPNQGTPFYLDNANLESAVASARQLGRSDVIAFPVGYGLIALDDYNQVVADRDSRFKDSDGDGLTDVKEVELGSSLLVGTTYYLRSAYTAAVAEAELKGRSQVTNNPQFYDLTTMSAFNAVAAERDARPTVEAYAAVVTQRDARFVDSDGDGLTDLKEEEIESNANQVTKFFLEEEQASALQASREAGQNNVLLNLQNFDLTTRAAYDAVAAERDSRFLDSDGDGLTDEKESELGTSSAAQTAFYLESSFETLFGGAREEGQNDVLSNPQNFDLTTKAAYDTVVAQRDSRFVDSDGDGLTDEKERTLSTDPDSETNFYLETAYNAAIEQAQVSAREEVTTNPQNYSLTSNSAYNDLIDQLTTRYLDSDGDGLTDTKEEELNTNPNVETLYTIIDSPLPFRISLAQTDGDDGSGENPPVVFTSSTTSNDPRYADADLDGITDAKELELNTDPAAQTTFYLQSALDAAVASSREAGRGDVTLSPQNYDLTPTSAYETVLAERDARFTDSDGDGLTDAKEAELATEAMEETTFYLESSYMDAVAAARVSGRGEVIANPQAYSLKTEAAYNLVVAQRDSRFLDSDGDGLTDYKEQALATNTGEVTGFYLQSALDGAVASAKAEGRSEVITNPSNFDLTSQTQYASVVAQRDARPTQEAYQVVVAERDDRFVDTDHDGLTDQKEGELLTDPTEETVFYLQSAYDSGVSGAQAAAREEVISSPQDYDLTTLVNYNLVVAQRDALPTQAAYESVVAQRDARPTLEAYNLAVTERDSRFEDTDEDGLTDLIEAEMESDKDTVTTFYLQDAYDLSNAQSVIAGQSEVIADPGSFGLITDAQYNAVVLDRDSRFVDTDADGITDVKEDELQTEADEATVFYLQEAYDLAVDSSRLAGRADVTGAPASFELFTAVQYESIVAERDTNLVTYSTNLAERDGTIEELNESIAEKDISYAAVVAERDARPTQDAFAEIIAERDARPTIGEIKDARLGSIVLQPDAVNNNVKIRFSIEETDDLNTWIKRDEISEVSVPLEPGKKFYRFAIEAN